MIGTVSATIESSMNFLRKAASAAQDALEETVKEEPIPTEKAAENTTDINAEEDFDAKSETVIPSMVRIFSGCMDSQTSADVSDVSGFGLPADSGPGGAGGACTNALLRAIATEEDNHLTWLELLDKMRSFLKEKEYTQVPQLSSSRKLDVMHEKYSPTNPTNHADSKRRALLIGINYVGQQGELRGCHNDVLSIKSYLLKEGFEEFNMKVLLDDGSHDTPSAKNILEGFRWLVDDAEDSDSLFLHYSGHGGHTADESGDEKDGQDETIIPVDYQTAGQITDDVLFEELVLPLPAGVQMTCLMDCCHSGTVLDLPYMIQATEDMDAAGAEMQQNPGFSFEKLMKIGKKLYELHSKGASKQEIATHAFKEIAPMMNDKKITGGLANLQALASGKKDGGFGGFGGFKF